MKPIKGRLGRYADNVDLKAYFGLTREQKLPRAGMPSIFIQDWLVWIEPIAEGGRKKHRILARCHECRKTISAGRIAQHLASHKT